MSEKRRLRPHYRGVTAGETACPTKTAKPAGRFRPAGSSAGRITQLYFSLVEVDEAVGVALVDDESDFEDESDVELVSLFAPEGFPFPSDLPERA
jgi:hypothetical protein